MVQQRPSPLVPPRHAEEAYHALGDLVAVLESAHARQQQEQAASLAALRARLTGPHGASVLLEQWRIMALDLADWVRQELAKGGLVEPPRTAPTYEEVLHILAELDVVQQVASEREEAAATAGR